MDKKFFFFLTLSRYNFFVKFQRHALTDTQSHTICKILDLILLSRLGGEHDVFTPARLFPVSYCYRIQLEFENISRSLLRLFESFCLLSRLLWRNKNTTNDLSGPGYRYDIIVPKRRVDWNVVDEFTGTVVLCIDNNCCGRGLRFYTHNARNDRRDDEKRVYPNALSRTFRKRSRTIPAYVS